MEVVKSTKNITDEIGKGVEVVGKKVSEAFDNLASHLPFANLAKKDDSEFHIEVDLPGVVKDDIDINLEDDVLVITAIRQFKNETTRDDYYIYESSFGKMERRFVIPENIDTSKVEASYEDGLLEITLHKTEKAQAKTIAIK
jgi:HSP20 family protein